MTRSPPPANVTRALRDALGDFATGVTVITARSNGGRFVGMTVNSFTSVSLHPPLVSWNLSLGAPSAPVFHTAGHYAVNILAAEQVELAKRFSNRHDDKFAGLSSVTAESGAPLIYGCAAWLECRVVARYQGGDHLILLGEVERFTRAPNHPQTLLFHRGEYRSSLPHTMNSCRLNSNVAQSLKVAR